MTYQGTVKNGVVVFESAAPPDGTPVRVEPLPEPSQKPGSIWEKLPAFAGRAPELPEDAARNRDHYLYGP
jgi:hypothetical protein